MLLVVGLGSLYAANYIIESNKQSVGVESIISTTENDPINLLKSNDNDPYVWICLGPSATKYHTNPKCKGLHSCSKEIKKVTRSYAEDKLGRTLCGYCKKKN